MKCKDCGADTILGLNQYYCLAECDKTAEDRTAICTEHTFGSGRPQAYVRVILGMSVVRDNGVYRWDGIDSYLIEETVEEDLDDCITVVVEGDEIVGDCMKYIRGNIKVVKRCHGIID